MDVKIQTTTTINLTEDEIKQAVAEYVNTLNPNASIEAKDVEFNAEMSAPETFGKVTAVCTKTTEK